MQALLFQGKKLGICIQLYTEFIKRSPPRPSPSWGGSSRRNTLVFRTNADGERLQISLKSQNSHFCTILRWEPFHFSHPTNKQPQNRSPPRPSPSWGGSSRRNTLVFRTNADGERLQISLKSQNSHFCTILRWEPFHFSHPTNKQPQNRSPPRPSPSWGGSRR